MDSIDSSDLDIKIVLHMLWSCTVTAVFFEINNLEPPVYSEPDKYYKYFDYHCGRPIKTDFSDMRNVMYKSYDKYAGDGTFLKIVSVIRENSYRK